MNRNTLIPIFTIFFVFCLNAQSPDQAPKKPKRFCEAGFNLYRLDYASHYLYQGTYYPDVLEHRFFRGASFKCYFGKNAIRSSVDYVKTADEPTFRSISLEERYSKTASLTIGYQRLFSKRRFSPYVFTDLGYSHLEKKGSYLYDCYVGMAPDFNTTYHLMTSMGSISAGFGLRYNPVKSIVLLLETNAQYLFIKERDLNNPSRPYKTRSFLVNPLQLSIGFIF